MRECPSCGKEYESIGKHWRWKSEHRPSISERQHDIIKGLMLGDGTLHKKDDPNPYFLCVMTNKEYLEYLKDEFGSLGKDVFIKHTAAESASNMRENGLRPDAKAENYKDVYKWATRSHNELHRYKDWYMDGEVAAPKFLDINPTILKHWYVSDGHLNTYKNSPRISIALTSQRHRKDIINSYFEKADLPMPRWSERSNDSNKRTEISWCKEESLELLEYMGSAPPGFERKWV